MAYVIAEPCIDTKDNSCVEVCPVDCIHPTPDEPDYDNVKQLYIDPEECIDCDACVEACPVDAIVVAALRQGRYAVTFDIVRSHARHLEQGDPCPGGVHRVDARLQAFADVGVPLRLEVVDDELDRARRRRCDVRLVAGLDEPILHEHRLQVFGRVTGQDQHFRHRRRGYSTVTVLARLRGWSTFRPRRRVR